MTRRFLVLPLLASLALFLGVGPVRADDGGRACQESNDHDRALAAVTAREIMPLSTILQSLSTVLDGALIDVELECEDGRILYVLEVRNAGGRIVELTVDAVTGLIVPDDDR